MSNTTAAVPRFKKILKPRKKGDNTCYICRQRPCITAAVGGCLCQHCGGWLGHEEWCRCVTPG